MEQMKFIPDGYDGKNYYAIVSIAIDNRSYHTGHDNMLTFFVLQQISCRT
jgi:hypothetical protein